MKALSKYKGSIKLSAIGDALGWITEFEKSKDDIKQKYKTENITSFYTWEKYVGGRFNGYKDIIQKGAYSDDTQLLLSVARSIKFDGTVDNDYFAKVELPSWLLYARGAGRTIKNAARKIERKSAKWYKNFYSYKIGNETINYRESGANGAAIRILPIALANFGDIEKIKSEIFYNSIITHGHPRAIVGAMLYGYAINTILRFSPDTFNFKLFITELGKDIEHKLSARSIHEKKEIKEWLTIWNKSNKVDFQTLYYDTIAETQNYLRHIYIYIKKGIDDKTVFNNIGCLNYKTKGSGISTVIAGIYLTSKYFLKPIQAIEIAVNMIGSDTDSIAAFTGGLLGALHGQSIIPNKWKNIQDYKYLDTIATKLLKISEEKVLPSNKIIISNDKKAKTFKITKDNFKINDFVFFRPLGYGTIKTINKQKALTKGKYNLIIDVDFEIGQSCRFAKLLQVEDDNLFNSKV